jgi:adenylosuccinate synthase
MASTSRTDFSYQTGNVEFSSLIFRAHIETVLHKKVARRLREIRNDTIWINGEDVAAAFKPMKMGLRIAHLTEPWDIFVEKYQRVR